jgi:hypothetical protein
MALIQSNGTGGGNWSDPLTWNGGVAPGVGDTFRILRGDTVTVDASDAANTPRCGAGDCQNESGGQFGHLDLNGHTFIISGNLTMTGGTNYYTARGGKITHKGGSLQFHQTGSLQYGLIMGAYSQWDIGMGSDAAPVDEDKNSLTTEIRPTDSNITSRYFIDYIVITSGAEPIGYFRNVLLKFHYFGLRYFYFGANYNYGGKFTNPNFGNITIDQADFYPMSSCSIVRPDDKPAPFFHFKNPDAANQVMMYTNVYLKGFNISDDSGTSYNFGSSGNGTVLDGGSWVIGDRSTTPTSASTSGGLTLGGGISVSLPESNSTHFASTETNAFFNSTIMLEMDLDIYMSSNGSLTFASHVEINGSVTIKNDNAAYNSNFFSQSSFLDLTNCKLTLNNVNTFNPNGDILNSRFPRSPYRLSRKNYNTDLIFPGQLPSKFVGTNSVGMNTPVEYITSDGGTVGGIIWQFRVDGDFQEEREASGASDPWTIPSGARFSSDAFDMADCDASSDPVIALFNYTPKSILSVTSLGTWTKTANVTVEVSINGGSFADATLLASWTGATYNGNGSDNIVLRVTKTSGAAGVAASWSAGSIVTTLSQFNYSSTRGLVAGQAYIESLIDNLETGGGVTVQQGKYIKETYFYIAELYKKLGLVQNMVYRKR